MKKIEPLNIVGSIGLSYDYMKRVVSSFAEIYHYDYIVPSLIDSEGNPSNGLHNACKSMKEANQKKAYFQEKTFDQTENNVYSFITLSDKLELIASDMIGLSVRLLKALGLKNLIVSLNTNNETLNNYLDCLDINYEVKSDFESKNNSDIQFKIIVDNDWIHNITLLEGKTIENGFSISGTFENLYLVTEKIGNLKTDNKLDLIMCYETKLECEHAIYLAQELRLNGFKTEIVFDETNANKIEEKYSARYLIKLHEEQLKYDEIELKDIDTKETKIIKELDLINHLDLNF